MRTCRLCGISLSESEYEEGNGLCELCILEAEEEDAIEED
jgi:NMD protein affecting ribosome stability and mRNA decay